MLKRTDIAMILAFVIGTTAILAFRSARAPETVLVGCFHTVAHKGTGCARITTRNDGKRTLELSNVELEGTNLEILLSSAPDAFENTVVQGSQTVSLGPARADRPIELADDLDLSHFHSATIWNRKYQVNYSTAPLR